MAATAPVFNMCRCIRPYTKLLLQGMIVIAAGNFYVNAVIILGHHYVGVEKGDLSKPGTKGSKEDSFIYKQVPIRNL